MTADIAPTVNTTSATAMIATLTKRIDGSCAKKMGADPWERREADSERLRKTARPAGSAPRAAHDLRTLQRTLRAPATSSARPATVPSVRTRGFQSWSQRQYSSSTARCYRARQAQKEGRGFR